MIPNLQTVAPGIYRSGQPVTPEDWKQIKDLGVKLVIKLNEDSEGSDEPWTALGGEVFKVQIPWTQQIITEPDYQSLIDAVGWIEPVVLVHCKLGQDRTGLLIALWRLTQGWTAADAEAEWRKYGGDNPFLPGLEKAWADLSKRMKCVS